MSIKYTDWEGLKTLKGYSGDIAINPQNGDVFVYLGAKWRSTIWDYHQSHKEILATDLNLCENCGLYHHISESTCPHCNKGEISW